MKQSVGLCERGEPVEVIMKCCAKCQFLVSIAAVQHQPQWAEVLRRERDQIYTGSLIVTHTNIYNTLKWIKRPFVSFHILNSVNPSMSLLDTHSLILTIVTDLKFNFSSFWMSQCRHKLKYCSLQWNAPLFISLICWYLTIQWHIYFVTLNGDWIQRFCVLHTEALKRNKNMKYLTSCFMQ